MEGAASWRRLLEVTGDIDAAEVLDTVLNPLVNVSTTDEAREDAFHDKVIRVRPARDAPRRTRRRSRADPCASRGRDSATPLSPSDFQGRFHESTAARQPLAAVRSSRRRAYRSVRLRERS